MLTKNKKWKKIFKLYYNMHKCLFIHQLLFTFPLAVRPRYLAGPKNGVTKARFFFFAWPTRQRMNQRRH